MPAVEERDGDLVRPFDNVIVREDISQLVDYETRSFAFHWDGAIVTIQLLAEKLPEERVVGERMRISLDHSLRVDVDDRGRALLRYLSHWVLRVKTSGRDRVGDCFRRLRSGNHIFRHENTFVRQ